MKQFDVVVIGGGTAGLAAARSAAGEGARVALVETGRLGGHFLPQNRIARQILDERKENAHPTNSFKDIKIEVEGRLQRHAAEIQQELGQTGIELFAGTGSLAGPGQVHISRDGDSTTLKAPSVILATGSLPKPVPTLPFDDEFIISIDRFWGVDDSPGSLLVVHGDQPGLEAADLAGRMGVKVFLVEGGDRLIRDQDPDMVVALEAAFKKKKIKVLAGRKIVSLFKEDDRLDVTLDGGIKFAADRILVSGERLGNTLLLGLNALGVETGKNQEVWVNEHMETSRKGVFAAGSITGRPHSLELSIEEGRVAGLNAAGGRYVLDKDAVPFILEMHPAIAGVGCRSSEAHYKGYRAVEGCYRFEDEETSAQPESSFCKIVADRSSRKIIGAQLCYEGAQVGMALIAAEIRAGATIQSLARRKDDSAALRPVIKAAQQGFKTFPVRR